MPESKNQLIQTLIETVMNGNKIKRNTTYENNIKRLKFMEIVQYCNTMGYIWKIEDIGRSQKIDLIKSIVKNLKE